MCDAWVALGNSTADGSVIFAKNSDREPNEAHLISIVPPADHADGSVVQCTYIQIPQVKHTYAVLLAKPFWIWGAEMGANEYGVVIGNEAVFTRIPYDKKPGLIGMDFLRLALERGTSAEEALKIIIQLLEQYGQGGSCGMTHGFYYHNSFLIADRSSAWVLETSGKQWAAEKVKDVRSISNAITIHNQWDRASADLVNYAVERGWCRGKEDFDFARCYSEPVYTRFSDASRRQTCATEQLRSMKGRISIETMMALLRSHRGDSQENFSPAGGLTGADICMHAGFGPIRESQTAGSMISHLLGENITHWVTGTSTPCTGIFKPVWLDAGVPDTGPDPVGTYDSSCLWWRHEALSREVMKNYPARIRAYRGERDQMESEYIRLVNEARAGGPEARRALSDEIFRQAGQAEQKWHQQVTSIPVATPAPFYYRMAWEKFNRQAKMPEN
jgi:dipeptidase